MAEEMVLDIPALVEAVAKGVRDGLPKPEPNEELENTKAALKDALTEITSIRDRLTAAEAQNAEKFAQMERDAASRQKSFMSPQSNETTEQEDWLNPDLQKWMGKTGRYADYVYMDNMLAHKNGLDKGFIMRNPDKFPHIMKALDTATDGSGADYVPTAFSPQLVLDIQQRYPVIGLFEEYPLATKTLTIPVEGGNAIPYVVAENTTSTTNITASTPSTDNFTFSTNKMGALVASSYEFEADALPIALRNLRSRLIRTLAYGKEHAIINGCASNTIDSDNTTAGDIRRLWAGNGLRAHCVANSSAVNQDANQAIAPETFAAMIGLMTDYGLDMDNLVWIPSQVAYSELLVLKDGDGRPMVQTVSAAGNDATIRNGTITRLFGIPIVPSRCLAANLNASGLYDGVTTDRTAMLLVWRPGWAMAQRGDVLLEVDRFASSQVIHWVATWRGDFSHGFGTNATVAMAYNI